MSKKDIRKYVQIVEGNYIPHAERTIKMKASPYVLYRTMQKFGGQYTDAVDAESGEGMMIFQDPLAYKYYTDILKNAGIKYEDVKNAIDVDSEAVRSPIPPPTFRDLKI